MTLAFDWTINISTIVSLAVFVGGSISIYMSWRNHSTLTDVQLNSLSESIKGLRDDMRPVQAAITSIAVQDERFRSLERRVNILEDRVIVREAAE